MSESQETTTPAWSPTSYYPFSPANPAYYIRHPSDITPATMHLVPPVNKFDTSRIDLLSDPSIDPHMWVPIIPVLLNWTEDPNWPSSHTIYPLLTSNPTTIEACIPLVIAILDMTDGRDDEHQNALLYNFVMQIGFEYQVQMLDCLKRFLRNITDELEWGYEWRDEVAELIGEIAEGMASPSKVKGLRS